MSETIGLAVRRNFLGHAPDWYKYTIIGFLILNPVLLYFAGPFVAGWMLIAEFIFALAMALKCYPLPAGGLLAIEAVVLGMTNTETVYQETLHNFPVILLLMFMVAGIYFMKDLLQQTFTRLLLGIRSKMVLSLIFCFAGALLSAFLDALTVTAVIIAVAYGFYSVYHRYASGRGQKDDHDPRVDDEVKEHHRSDLEQFRGFLRNLMMHGAVGTALGGVTTLVGEPQNLLIGHEMGWNFPDFFFIMAPVTMPVLAVGFLTCIVVERFGWFDYGYHVPEDVRQTLQNQANAEAEHMTPRRRVQLVFQAFAALLLVVSLALHLAEVGLIGLTVIVLLTAACGFVEEHQIGRAFEEALPFTALLVVFFAIVAVIHDQHLFAPVIEYVISREGKEQVAAYYIANGLLSAISDNVFVATVYISETKIHFVHLLETLPGVQDGRALMDALNTVHGHAHDAMTRLPETTQAQVIEMLDRFDLLAVAINTGTNIPSVATPNGQAAFLFLLTSALAPVIRLSYLRMVLLALPYTITMSGAGLAAVWFLL